MEVSDERKKDYSGLLPVTQVSIMDYQLFDDHREFFGRYRLLNEKDSYPYSDLISVYVLDLNAADAATPEDIESGRVIWAKMFKASTWEEIKEIARQYSTMKEVAESMYEAVTDKETYQQIRTHEKAIMDQRAMIAYAETKGRAEGRVEGKAEGRAEGKVEERAEGKAEGRAEGKIEGRIEGETLKEIKQTLSKVRKGKSLPEIADELESTEKEIRPIYEVIIAHKGISDPEKLYEILLRKEVSGKSS